MAQRAREVVGARRTALNVLLSAAAQVVGKALTLVWTLVAARELHPGDFGVFFYALAVATLITAVAEWGFDTVLVREGSRVPGRLGGLTKAAFRLELGLALPALILGGLVVVASQHSGRTRLAVAFVFAAALFEVLSDTCRAVAQAAQRQAGVSGALIVQRFVSAALIVGVLVRGSGLLGLCAAFFAGTVVGAAAHLIALRRLRIDLSGSWRAELRPMVRASWFIGASDVALLALAKVDTVLVQLLGGTAEVGLYSATYRLLDTVLFVVFALSAGLFPVMSASGRAEDASTAIRTGTTAAALAYAPFIAACLVDAGPITRLVYGNSFAEAAPALRWLCVASIWYAISFLGHAALQALDLARWLLLTACLSVVVNVAVNIVLIPRYGATGAAAATTVAYAVEAVVVLVVLRRVRGVRSGVAGVLVVPTIAGLGFAGMLAAVHWPVALEVPAGAVLYLVLAAGLTRVLRPTDLTALRSLLRRGVSPG